MIYRLHIKKNQSKSIILISQLTFECDPVDVSLAVPQDIVTLPF